LEVRVLSPALRINPGVQGFSAPGACPFSAQTSRLIHPDDPELNEHVYAAIAAKHSGAAGASTSPDRSSKIDAVVALAIAVERQAYQPCAPP
jgi:hypothetical protein